MKKSNTILKILSILVIFPVIFTPLKSVQANENSIVIEIATSPKEILFDYSNIKPGDVIERRLKIRNTGNKNFTYNSKVQFKSGSKLLYGQLYIMVKNNERILYEGKLSHFKKLDSRLLERQSVEEIIITVEFPWESGNEFQGLATEFVIEFYAEGNESTVHPPVTTPTNGGLPQTGESNPIWYYLSGIMLAGVGIGIMRQSLKGDRPRIRLKR